MNPPKRYGPFPIHGLLLALIFCAHAGPAGAQEERASLRRTYDVVQVTSDDLDGFMNGTPVEDLRLVRLGGQLLAPVPFDVMKRDEDGNYVLDGMNRNVEWRGGTYEIRESSVKAAGDIRKVRIEMEDRRADQSGPLGGVDEVLFQARDAGDRYTGGFPQARKALEVELQDPVDGGRGWVYLLDAPDMPLSPVDYVSYAFDASAQSERVKAAGGTEVTFDLKKSAAYRDFVLPVNGGLDIAHTFRAEASFGLKPVMLRWLPRFSINPEDSSIPILVGYRDGVFVVRVVKSKIDNFLMEKYLGDEIKRSELVTVSHYFPRYQYFRGKFPLAKKLRKWMKDLDVVMTTDFNKNARGMRFYNSRNLEGCVVDGRMDAREQALDDAPYAWSMLTGENGGWANILNMLNNRDKMRLFYDDDGEKDIWGSIGYRLKKLDDVDAMEFVTYIFLLPPNADPGFMEQLLNLVYKPLEVRTGRKISGDVAPEAG